TPRTVAKAPFDDPSTADVIILTSDNVSFYTHKIILSIASPHFKEILSQPKLRNDELFSPTKPREREIVVEEDGQTMDYVLRLCYPCNNPPSGATLPLAIQLACAADRYKMSDALLAAKNILLEYADAHPLPVYFVARRYGWDDLADEAEKECMRLPSLTAEACYTEQMEHVNADVYYELLGRHY
ncbi:hypothetical protein K474DRAFT_1566690, partial [Panus rudis PR-1116 ss-1]